VNTARAPVTRPSPRCGLGPAGHTRRLSGRVVIVIRHILTCLPLILVAGACSRSDQRLLSETFYFGPTEQPDVRVDWIWCTLGGAGEGGRTTCAATCRITNLGRDPIEVEAPVRLTLVGAGGTVIATVSMDETLGRTIRPHLPVTVSARESIDSAAVRGIRVLSGDLDYTRPFSIP